MEQKEDRKIFVKVRADHELDGTVVPIAWKADGENAVKIDKILDIRKAAALKVGGQGIRYLCRVGEEQIALFHDADIWFLEIERHSAG